MEEKNTVAKVVTVGIYQQGGADECERSLKELERLVETAGGKVFATLTQMKNTPEAATYIGEGKLNELADICKNNNANKSQGFDKLVICFMISLWRVSAMASPPSLILRRYSGESMCVSPCSWHFIRKYRGNLQLHGFGLRMYSSSFPLYKCQPTQMVHIHNLHIPQYRQRIYPRR